MTKFQERIINLLNKDYNKNTAQRIRLQQDVLPSREI